MLYIKFQLSSVTTEFHKEVEKVFLLHFHCNAKHIILHMKVLLNTVFHLNFADEITTEKRIL